MSVFSKPHFPLGMERADEHRGVILYEPYQTAPSIACAICLSPVIYNTYIEVADCGHVFCEWALDSVRLLRILIACVLRTTGKYCVLRYAVVRALAGQRFTCPMCRSSTANIVLDTVLVTPNHSLPYIGKYRMFAVADVFSNFHVFGVTHTETGEHFVNSNLGTKYRRIPAFSHSQMCCPVAGGVRGLCRSRSGPKIYRRLVGMKKEVQGR